MLWQASNNPRSSASRRDQPTSTTESESGNTSSTGLKDLDTSAFLTPETPVTPEDLTPEDRATYEALDKPERLNFLAVHNHLKAVAESPATAEQLENAARQLGREMARQGRLTDSQVRKRELGFWADGEDDEIAQVEDGDDEDSDEHITSMAETQLELHREIREYTRIAAWDMPLLSSMFRRYHPHPLNSPLFHHKT